MNIEPAILVMHHSMRPHPAITATLLDFLCRIILNFTVGREQEKVRNGIYNSLKQILDKRVLPSLSPLFDNARLDKELRCMLRDRYAPFCSTKDLEELSPTQQQSPLSTLPTANQNMHQNQINMIEGNLLKEEVTRDHEDGDAVESDNEDPVEFSDEDDPIDVKCLKVNTEPSKNKSSNIADTVRKSVTNTPATLVAQSGAGNKHKLQSSGNNSIIPGAKSPLKESSNKRQKIDSKSSNDTSTMIGRGINNSHQPIPNTNSTRVKSEKNIVKVEQETERGENEDEEDVLDDDIKDILKDLKSPNSDCEKKCEIMDQLVKHVISEELDYEQCSTLASNLAEILQDQFEGRIFPETPTEESIEDSIGKPLFVVFRALCEMTDSDPHRVHILMLLAELYTLQPRLGKILI